MTVTDEMVERGTQELRELDGMRWEPRDVVRAILTAALSDQAGGWQDISTAPRNNSAVLVYCPLKTITFIATAFWDTVAEEWRLAWTGIANSPSKIINPTHWQHLPAPPPSSTAGEGKHLPQESDDALG